MNIRLPYGREFLIQLKTTYTSELAYTGGSQSVELLVLWGGACSLFEGNIHFKRNMGPR